MNPNQAVANPIATLEPSESIFRALFSASIDAVLLTSPDGRILAANPAACRLFGRSAEELCAVGRNGVVDKVDPRFAAALDERDRHGCFRGELTFVRRNGEKFIGQVSAAVFPGPNGEPCASMVIRDVTEAMRTLEALAASEERYRGLLESAFDGIVIHQDGLIISVNAPYAAMFGYPVEELIGKPVIELTAPEVRESILENIRQGVVRAYATVACAGMAPASISNPRPGRAPSMAALPALRQCATSRSASELRRSCGRAKKNIASC